ncbi:MAG: hypothetical protein ACKESB_02795 [Candidatus Hodgkinia cicadicola]
MQLVSSARLEELKAGGLNWIHGVVTTLFLGASRFRTWLKRRLCHSKTLHVFWFLPASSGAEITSVGFFCSFSST